MEERNQRFPGLDGVRAFAVLAVLAFHDGRLRGGFLGVSTFFTLSGFLITRLLILERRSTGGISLGAFFGRRVRRLMPAALAGVALAALVSLALTGARAAMRGDGIAAIANVVNWRFIFAGRSYADLFAVPSPLTHYWSLSVEEQFYLVLAPTLALLLAVRRGSRVPLTIGIVGLGAASFVAGWLLLDHSGLDRAYYGTDARAVEFLVGAFLAVVITGRTLSRGMARVFAGVAIPAALALGWAAMSISETDPFLFRGGLLLHAAIVAVVLVGVMQPGPLTAVCSLPPFVGLGIISYGVYVFHWPIFLYLDQQRTGLDAGALTMLRLAVTIALAALSYVFLERPIRTGRWKRPVRWAIAPVALGAIVAVVLVISATAPPPAIRLEPVSAELPEAPVTTPPLEGPTGDAASQVPTAPTEPTAPPAPPAPPVVLVVGDSVGLTVGRGIERWGMARGVIVDNQTVWGCTIHVGVQIRGYFGTRDRGPDPCQSLARFPTLVQQVQPDVVVLLYGAWDVYDTSWDSGDTWFAPGDAEWNAHYKDTIAQTIELLSATGARMLWLTPPCFEAPRGDIHDGEWFDPARVQVLGDLADEVAPSNGMTVSHELTRTGCPVDFDARPDGVHYDDPGADDATALLVPELERLLAARP